MSTIIETDLHEHPLTRSSIRDLCALHPAYGGGAGCNNCGDIIPGSWNCSSCQFDLCGDCMGLENDPPKVVTSPLHADHELRFMNIQQLVCEGYTWMSCDQCGSNIISSFHCSECGYDLCLMCALNDTFSFYAGGDDSEGKENLALDKPVKCSSIEDDSHTAAMSVDGDDETRWASDSSDPQWLEVDLGACCPVSHVCIKWEAAFATNYEIQISEDRISYTTVATVKNNAEGWVKTPFPDDTKAMFVRMYGSQRGTCYGYSIYHFKVYGSSVESGVAGVVVTSDNVTLGARVVRGLHWPPSASNDGIQGYPGTVLGYRPMHSSTAENVGKYCGPEGCCVVAWDLIKNPTPHKIGLHGKYELYFLQGYAPEGASPGLQVDTDVTTVDPNMSTEVGGEVVEETKTIEMGLWDTPRWERHEWKEKIEALNSVHTKPISLNHEKVVRVLQGHVDEKLVQSKQKSISIFVSSTFTDTYVERNLLIADVYPYLKRYALQLGFEFSASEMRWGIREESSNSHQTADICMAELQRCQVESAGLDYVLILGNKYGFRPFPATIPADEFNALVNTVEKDDIETGGVIREWFILDTNTVPSAYRLRSSAEAEKGAWWGIFERIQSAFQRARYCLEDESRQQMYTVSVTECEALNGLLCRKEVDDAKSPPDPEQTCAYYYRRLIRDMESHVAHPKGGMFIDKSYEDQSVDTDAQQLLKILRDEKVVQAMEPSHCIKDFEIEWGPEIGIDTHREYLKEFCDHFCGTLCDSISSAAQATLVEPDDVYEEAMRHAAFCISRSRSFVGRKEIMHTVQMYLNPLSSAQNEGATPPDCHAPLVLYGRGGSGKSCTMAKCVVEMGLHLPRGSGKSAAAAIATPRELDIYFSSDSVCIVRFIGTTPQSTTISDLLQSVCRQICRNYNVPLDLVPKDYRSLVSFFPTLLENATEEKPLVIFFDSLDQLSSEDNAHNLSWLPLKLPMHCRFVVSAIHASDESGNALIKLQSLIPSMNQVELLAMSRDDGDAILSAWLQKSNRALTPDQTEIVLQSFQQCPLPLYLNIAFQLSRTWSSHTVVNDLFPPSIPSLLADLFSRLCVIHGRMLVHHCLGYLTLAKRGLSRAELEDILSLDDDVLNDVYQWWVPPVRRIPGLLVTRLLSDVEMYIVTQGADGGIPVLSWYHREFKVAAREIFLSDRTQKLKLASVMSEYFSSKWSDRPKPFLDKNGVQGCAQRKVAPQELVLTSLAVSKSDTSKKFNQRRISELPCAQIYAQQWEKVENTLCDVRLLEASTQLGVIQETLMDMRLAKDEMLRNDTPLSIIPDALMFLNREIYSIRQKPDLFYQYAVNQPSDSIIHKMAVEYLSPPKHGWLRLVGHPPESALITNFLTGPTGSYTTCLAVTFSPDGKYLASITSSDTGGICHLGVFDLASNAEMFNFSTPWKTPSLSCVTWTPNGQNVVLPISKNELWFISGKIGVLQKVVKNKSCKLPTTVTGVVALSDTLFVTGHKSDSNSLGIWETEADKVKSVSIDGEGATYLAVTNDRSHFVSVTSSGSCRVWDASTLSELRSFSCPNGITHVSISSDGTMVAVNRGNDGTFGWEGDGAAVYCEAFINPKFLSMPELDISGQSMNTVGISFHPNNDNILYVLNSSNQVYAYDISKERMLATFEGPGNCYEGGMTMSPTGEYLASVGQGNNVFLWNPAGTGLSKFPSGEIGAIALLPDGSGVCVSHSCAELCYIYSTEFPTKVLKAFKNTKNMSTSCVPISIGGSGSRIVTATNSNCICVVDLTYDLTNESCDKTVDNNSERDNGVELRFLDTSGGRVKDVVIHPSGEYTVVLGEKTLEYISTRDGTQVWKKENMTSSSNGRAGGRMMQMSASGEELACYDIDDNIVFLSTEDGECKRTSFTHPYATCFHLSSENFDTLIISSPSPSEGIDQGIAVYKYDETNSWNKVRVFAAHDTNITGLRILPSAFNAIISCSEDGTLKVWDFESGELRCIYYNPGRQFINSMDLVLCTDKESGAVVPRIAIGDATGRVKTFDWVTDS